MKCIYIYTIWTLIQNSMAVVFLILFITIPSVLCFFIFPLFNLTAMMVLKEESDTSL